MSRLVDARRVLLHYFRMFGAPPDGDVDAEIEGIVDDIVHAAREPLIEQLAALEGRVQALEAGRPTVVAVEGPDQIAALRDALRPIVEALPTEDPEVIRERVRRRCRKLIETSKPGDEGLVPVVRDLEQRHSQRYAGMLAAAQRNPSAYNVPELRELLAVWGGVKAAGHLVAGLQVAALQELDEALADEVEGDEDIDAVRTMPAARGGAP